MKVIHLIICASVVIIGYIIIKKKCRMCATLDGTRENYGGNQTRCEEACFSSDYYDACMNSCLQQGHADYMETGDEYDVLGVGQVDDLDRGFGYSTPQSQYEFGLRGETPGR